MGTSSVIIKDASSSSARNKAPTVKLVEPATRSLNGSFVTDATTLPTRLHVNQSIEGLSPPSIMQNLHGLSFITSKDLDSWLLHGHGSVQQLARHLVGMPLPRLSPLALLQTAHGQPSASVGVTEPGDVIITPGGSANAQGGQQLANQWQIFVSILISGLLTSVLAFFYWRYRKPPERQPDAVHDEGSFKVWRFGLFGCFSDPEICIWACCCPAIRWADTLRYMGFLGFWIAFAIFCGLETVVSTTGQLAVWIVLVIVCVAMRQEMRIAYGMHEQGGWTYLEDFLLYCCCSCCTIIQEARQVEEAYKVGYPIEVRPSWTQGAAPHAAHVQGVPARDPPAAATQGGSGSEQP